MDSDDWVECTAMTASMNFTGFLQMVYESADISAPVMASVRTVASKGQMVGTAGWYILVQALERVDESHWLQMFVLLDTLGTDKWAELFANLGALTSDDWERVLSYLASSDSDDWEECTVMAATMDLDGFLQMVYESAGVSKQSMMVMAAKQIV